MGLSFKVKHRFFNAFRELFVHHHGSLDFRAKIFALLIAANEKATDENYTLVRDIGLNIYNNDMDRSNLLMLSTQELVQKMHDNKGLDIDSLITSILKDLKVVPRYAKKINIKALKPFVLLSQDENTIAYQNSILEFLQKTKDETLHIKH